ncbi:hypothetical protein [Streptosporangium sp. KLBMP 9127]|nr:hypothetical protein [Streptosporangium sp. KLBMP 9127]
MSIRTSRLRKGTMALLTAATLAVGASAAPAQAASALGASTSSAASSFCFANQWTQVHWYINPFWPVSYRYHVPGGGLVRWRWFSGGVPPYWENSFTGTGDIWTPPSPYTSVEFNCSNNSDVFINGL